MSCSTAGLCDTYGDSLHIFLNLCFTITVVTGVFAGP